jgi:NAD(P)H dehydrogenase (quinone)
MSQRLLVSGAGGRLGRRITELLLRGSAQVIAATRDVSKLADLSQKGVEVCAADFDNPSGLISAFKGVDRLLLISTDEIFVAGRRVAQHKAAIKAAAQAGVKHILYTSMIAPSSARSPAEDDHFRTEQAIQTSGMSWTILRNSPYAENLLWMLPKACDDWIWRTASGKGECSWITRDDAALACASLLSSSETTSKTYVVTGGESLCARQVALIAAEVSGKPIRHAATSAEIIRQRMAALRLPARLIDSLIGFDVAMAHGLHATVTPIVEDVKGSKPMTVREFLSVKKNALLK